MDEPEASWAVVVPVRGGPLAKSRLALPVAVRAALADAFARDTVAALVAAPSVREVLVVTSDAAVAAWVPSAGGRVVPDPGGGLDAAVAAGGRAATVGVQRVAVVLGDHPALRPREVEDALRAASGHERAVVADDDGTGTAMLTWSAASSTGSGTATAFGPGSAAAHASLGYDPVALAAPGLRVDVDDAPSLATATLLGLGAATRSALERASLPGVQATIHRIEDDGSGAALLDDGLEVVLPPGAATTSGLRHLRVGQRVSIELDDAGRAATRVWIVGIGPGETIR